LTLVGRNTGCVSTVVELALIRPSGRWPVDFSRHQWREGNAEALLFQI
jgi:hypothetical protein